MTRLFHRLMASNLLVSGATILASFAGLAISVGVPLVLAPERYAVFATTWATGQFLATLGFEWMRFGVLRFGHGADAAEVAARRRVLWGAYLVTGIGLIGLAIVAGLAALAGWAGAMAMAGVLFFAAMNGGFDGYLALMRAEGQNARFSAGRILRTFISFVLAMGAAILFGTASAVLLGLSLSFPIALYLVAGRGARWPERGASVSDGARVLRQLFAFGLFAALTTNLAMILPALQRLAAVRGLGPAEAAGVALSFDLAQKAISVVGLAVNVVVMQASIRVAEFETDAAVQARQAGRQFALTLAVVAPAAVGFYLLGDPLAVLAVRPAMQANFGATLLPATIAAGLLAFRMFSIDPLFVIRKKTRAGIWGAGLTALAMAVPLAVPGLGIAGLGWSFAGATALGVALSLAILVTAVKVDWPLRDLGSIVLGSVAMVLVTMALPPMAAGAGLASRFLVAGGVYALVVVAADVVDIRTGIIRRGRR